MNNIIRKKLKGSLTVEATLVLPLVIVTLLFVANILNICMVNTCMQQSLNNTAKKISQNSYLIYRFAGGKNYEDFINKLNNINDGYSDFESKAENTKMAFAAVQDSIKDVSEDIEKVKHTSDEFVIIKVNKNNEEIKEFDILRIPDYCNKLIDNLSDLSDKIIGDDGLIKKAKNVGASLTELCNSGKQNFKSIVLKLFMDEGSGSVTAAVSTLLFNNYTKELGVPASKISELNAFHSSLNPDGSFTIVVSYLYVNPFSFINKKSMEYSVINRNIRMTNAITIKPFVGKNGTSIKTKLDGDVAEDDNDIIVFIPTSTYNVEVSDRKFHKRAECGSMKDSTPVKLSAAQGSSNISGPCHNCFTNEEIENFNK